MIWMRPRRPRPLVIALVAAALASGCSVVRSLTGPSDTWKLTVPTWSPYVVIQPDDGALGGYDDALGQLAAHGAAHGARINLHLDGSAIRTVQLAAKYSLDILGLLDDADLSQPDVVAVFDQYVARYPQVKTFQIGNEITTLPDAGRMSIDTYLDVFSRIADHVRSSYPGITLVSQSPVGSGNSGAAELTAMTTRFAAAGYSTARTIVAINVYTQTALTAYAAALSDRPTSYPLWVTETGVPDETGQVTYVNTTYPELRLLLHADRIYWYALWAGDSGGDSAFSLITGPTHPPIATRSLFQRLVS